MGGAGGMLTFIATARRGGWGGGWGGGMLTFIAIGIAVLQSSAASFFFSVSFSLHSAMRFPGRHYPVQFCLQQIRGSL